MGDSKTHEQAPFANTWPLATCKAVSAAMGGRPLRCGQHGTPGSTVANWASNIAGVLALYPDHQPSADVGIGLGVNDVYYSMPDEATWKANYLSIIDAITAKWPSTRVFLAYPWAQGKDTESATVHGWIDDIIAARPGVAFAGPDEAVWLEGGDDGATNTTDGIHLSATGQTAAEAAWLSAMGY